MNLITNISAPLPATYEQAKNALAQCQAIDECKDWADKAAALASYARQSEDLELEKMAQRIRARAMRRAGELAKQMMQPHGGDRKSDQVTHDHNLIPREKVQEVSGFSKHQLDTSLRVASIPERQFTEQVEWITTHFLNSRGQIGGEGAALYRYCTRAHVSRIVKRVVGKYDVEARAVQDAQIVLEGFEHLQRAYTLSRDEKIVLVPIHKCHDHELLARADEYEKQAKGCRLHARELRSFVRNRGTSQAA